MLQQKDSWIQCSVNDAKEFQKEFIESMRNTGASALADLKAGKLSEEAVASVEQIAKDTAARFTK